MVNELVIATVEPEKRDEYVEIWKRAFKEGAFAGSHGGKILRCVEDPGRIVMLINWDTVEAHEQHRGTDKHNQFRETFRPLQKEPSFIQHYTIEDLPA